MPTLRPLILAAVSCLAVGVEVLHEVAGSSGAELGPPEMVRDLYGKPSAILVKEPPLRQTMVEEAPLHLQTNVEAAQLPNQTNVEAAQLPNQTNVEEAQLPNQTNQTEDAQTSPGPSTSEENATDLNATTTLSSTDMPAPWVELAPVGVCKDQGDTGVRFRNGGVAACKDLVNYCEHPTLGHRVKEACVKTCGRCDLSTLSSIMIRCEDQAPHVLPVITVGGVAASCSYLDHFCHGFNGSEYVLRKCPRTCLFCNPETTVTTTTLWHFSTTSSDVDTAAIKLGCNRRRRFGFCGPSWA